MDKKRKAGIVIAAVLLALALGSAAWYGSAVESGRIVKDNQTTEESGPEEKNEEEKQDEETEEEVPEEEASEGEEEISSEEENGESANSGSSQNTGDSYPRPAGTSVVSNPESIAVLVNKANFLPEGWEPSDLVSVGGGQQLRAEAATALSSLKAAAEADGYTFNVISGYRTKETQISLYSNYMAQDPEGAPYLSAYPRSSEHELGLAMDISPDWSLHYDLLETGLGKWMTAHAHEYGWILRYPEGKTEVTGYVFEAWHYRYVGKSLAAEIKSSGLTLEEYYGSI
ncbi:MAG TPA: M15 family metallopeptidase [Candidatus Avanaerovorax faecigallinarum]|nr:M15 family metallopeptidase [Candidatus Avanaerovorax faecigallinarum]